MATICLKRKLPLFWASSNCVEMDWTPFWIWKQFYTVLLNYEKVQCETKGFEKPKPILTVPASDTYFHIYSGRVNDLAPFWLASERFKAVQDKTFVRKNMTIRIWGALTIIWWDSITTSWWYEDIRWRGKMMINVKTTTTVVAEVGLKDSAGLLDFTCNLSKWWGHHSSKPIGNSDKYI